MGHTLKGVEIFRAGTWNGDEYTAADLDEMVRAFDKVGFQPPVKLGHSKSPGEQAYGWVSKIWRKGEKLLADLAQIPGELYERIKSGAYRHVSAEIFWQLERNNVTFPRALKAVAILGSEIPAVSGLQPLEANLTAIKSHYETYAMPLRMLEDGDDDEEESHMQTDPSTALDRLTKNYMHANPGLPYSKALHAVQATDEGRALMAAYNNEKHGGVRLYFQNCGACGDSEGCKKMGMCKSKARSSIKQGKYADPSAELHKRAKALLREEKATDLSSAARLAMKLDPELAGEYASWSVNH